MKNEKPIIFIGFVSDLKPTLDENQRIIFMGKDKKFYKFLPTTEQPTQAPPIINQYGK